MALRAVTDHPKFFRLKGLLKLNKSCALGYLEALWHFCGKYTPQGNIGKYSDADVEAWLEWDGEEGALVAACVKAGWLCRNDAHRLIVHDWSQYADEIVHTDLARKCLRFADGVLPKTGRLNKHERARYQHAFPEAKDSHGAASAEGVESGSRAEAGASQTESDMGQTKSDLGTKPEPEPEPEPEPARETTTPQPPKGGEVDDGSEAARDGDGLGAEEQAELDEVNAMRARMAQPPLAWEAYAPSRNLPPAKGVQLAVGRRRRERRVRHQRE